MLGNIQTKFGFCIERNKILYVSPVWEMDLTPFTRLEALSREGSYLCFKCKTILGIKLVYSKQIDTVIIHAFVEQVFIEYSLCARHYTNRMCQHVYWFNKTPWGCCQIFRAGENMKMKKEHTTPWNHLLWLMFYWASTEIPRRWTDLFLVIEMIVLYL